MIERYLLQTAVAPLATPSIALAANALIAISADGYGIAEKLAALLKKQGYSNTQLVREMPAVCEVAIVLDGLRAFASVEEAMASNFLAFQQLRRIAAHFTEHGGRLLTVQATGGKFGLSPIPAYQAWSAGIAALTKTAALEWPKAHCTAVDLQIADQTSERLAMRLLEEIFTPVEKESGVLADGRRIILQTKLSPLNTSEIPVWVANNNTTLPVFLVTGGGRGVTAECLMGLAKTQGMRLVLFGRTPLVEEPDFSQAASTEAELKQLLFADYQTKKITVTPKQINEQVGKILANRDIHHSIKTLTNLGCEVKYLAVDVANKETLAAALTELRNQWGSIDGIIHGAGVLADKWIAEKTDEQFNFVFQTKVLGLKNLLELTANDPLQLLVFFSSVAARYGNPGQCDYAMANEVLNKIAQQEQRRRKNCRVKSINWGPWAGGMVTPQLQRLFAERGVGLIPIEAGVKQFIDELSQNNNVVEVVIGGELVPSEKSAVTSTTVSIDANSHPYLRDHAIKGVPVVPICLVLEWFAQAAKYKYPEFKALEFRHLKVLKGIRLNHYHQQPESFLIHCEEKNSGSRQLLLTLTTSDSSSTYYSCELFVSLEPAQSIPIASYETTGAPWPYSASDIYDKTKHPQALFHGPKFQVISNLQQVSENGGSAILKSNSDWTENFCTDSLVLDGALQLFLLWTSYKLQKNSVPMAIEFLHINRSKLAAGSEKRCLFQGQIQSEDKTTFNALITGENGQVYAEFKGVEILCYE